MYVYMGNSNIFLNIYFLYYYLMYKTVICTVCEKAGWVTEKWVICREQP